MSLAGQRGQRHPITSPEGRSKIAERFSGGAKAATVSPPEICFAAIAYFDLPSGEVT